MSANLFINLPAPAANGAGAAVDTSTLAPGKSIVVAGAWPQTATPIITVEINNDGVPNGSWSALASIQGAGVIQVSAVARWMRVLVGNYTTGQAPQVDIGAVDDVPQFANLAVNVGTGVGAAVDVSALGPLKTVTVGDAFRGGLVIEVSEDGVNNWATAMSFNQPGQQTKEVAAHWMRTRRSGVPVLAPGLPIVNVGGTFGASSGGGGGVDVDQNGAPVVAPATILNFTGSGVTVTNAGGGQANIAISGVFIAGAGAGSAIQNNASGNVAPAASAFGHGEGASGLREGQEAFANGVFAVAGDAQTSIFVLRGSTPGAAPGETVELMFGTLANQTIQLEDGKGYILTIEAIAKDRIDGGKGVQGYVQRYSLSRAAGLSALDGVGAKDQFGSPGSATWTLNAAIFAAPDRVGIQFATIGTQSNAHCVARVTLTEVLNG